MATEKKVSERWIEKNGVIRLCDSLVSDGTQGEGWINRLTKGDYRLSGRAKQVLRSDHFHPKNGTTYQVVIFKGGLFFDEERVTKNVRAQAKKLNLQTPNPEVAPLLRKKLSDEKMEKMGLTWLIIMHKPIYDFAGNPLLMHLDRYGAGPWIRAHVAQPAYRWHPDPGFVFVAVQDAMA